MRRDHRSLSLFLKKNTEQFKVHRPLVLNLMSMFLDEPQIGPCRWTKTVLVVFLRNGVFFFPPERNVVTGDWNRCQNLGGVVDVGTKAAVVSSWAVAPGV